MPRKRDELNTPRVPVAPDLPGVPKSSTLRDKFSSFAPDIPIPNPDPIPDAERRKAEWQSQYPAMSELEFIVMDYLTRKKGWRVGREFEYQLALAGGRTQFGGFVIDFFVRPNLVLQPQGERWHLQQPKDRGRIKMEKILMSSRGFITIYLWESDLLTRPEFTIEAALKGQELNTFRNDI